MIAFLTKAVPKTFRKHNDSSPPVIVINFIPVLDEDRFERSQTAGTVRACFVLQNCPDRVVERVEIRSDGWAIVCCDKVDQAVSISLLHNSSLVSRSFVLLEHVRFFSKWEPSQRTRCSLGTSSTFACWSWILNPWRSTGPSRHSWWRRTPWCWLSEPSS